MRLPDGQQLRDGAGEVREQRIHHARFADADDGDAGVLFGGEVHPATPVSSSSPQPANLPRQLGAAAVDAGLDGAFRQLQPVGNLLIRQLLNIAQQHRRAQRRRQLSPSPSSAASTRSRCSSAAIGLMVGAAGVSSPGVDVAIDRLALLAHAAVVVDAEIAADADQPGLKVRAPVERVERLEDLQEDVLRQILGLVVLAGELVGDVEDLAPVLPDDLRPRVLIARQAALDERVDRVRVLERCRTSGVAQRRQVRLADARAATDARRGPPISRFPGRTRPRLRGMIAGSDACRRPRLREPARRVSPIDGVPLAEIAARVGTPCYVYSAAAIRDGLPAPGRGLRRLSARDSLRAQGQLDARHRPAAQGARAAASTPTRWARSTSRCAAAFSPSQIMFTGVGKSADELDRAPLRSGSRRSTSSRPASSIGSIGWRRRAAHRRARGAARQSRHRRAQPPAHLDRAQDNKFGVPIEAAPEIFREIRRRARARRRRRAQSHRLADHVARAAAARRARRRSIWRVALRADGVPLRHIDFGGGVGISYDGTPAIDPAEYAPRARRASCGRAG